MEIAADATLVISLATVLDVTGRNVLWVLLVVPVLEGALRYRLRGAMIVWGLMAFAYVGVALLTSGADGDQFLVDVEQAVQHMGVVLLITVPAGFLSEQLVLDIRNQQTAREQAVQRGNLLEAVAEAGHRVTSLEVEAVQAVTQAALDLGFDRVDLGVRRGDDWFAAGAQPTDGPGLPTAGRPGRGRARRPPKPDTRSSSTARATSPKSSPASRQSAWPRSSSVRSTPSAARSSSGPASSPARR